MKIEVGNVIQRIDYFNSTFNHLIMGVKTSYSLLYGEPSVIVSYIDLENPYTGLQIQEIILSHTNWKKIC